MTKGSNWERRFVKECRNLGYPTARIGASGAGTSDDLPDVIVMGDSTTYVLELKYRSEPYVLLSDDEVEALDRFGSPDSATPLIAFRTDGRTYDSEWKIIDPRDLNSTQSGWSMTQQEYDNALSLEEYLEVNDE